MKVLKLYLVLICVLFFSLMSGCGGSDSGGGGNSGETEVYPKLYCTIADNEVEVWQGQGVTDEQMDSFKNMMNEWYLTWNNSMKDSFKDSINKIEVRVSVNISHEGDTVFLPYNITLNECADYLADNGLILFAPPDTPYNHTVIIGNLFGNAGNSTTVKGIMTAAQWTGVADKVKNAINAVYEQDTPSGKEFYTNLFNGDNAIIIIEIAPTDYTKWKAVTDGNTLYLAYDILDDVEYGLKSYIYLALNALYNNISGSE
jgi:hypothetical protein